MHNQKSGILVLLNLNVSVMISLPVHHYQCANEIMCLALNINTFCLFVSLDRKHEETDAIYETSELPSNDDLIVEGSVGSSIDPVGNDRLSSF